MDLKTSDLDRVREEKDSVDPGHTWARRATALPLLPTILPTAAAKKILDAYQFLRRRTRLGAA